MAYTIEIPYALILGSKLPKMVKLEADRQEYAKRYERKNEMPDNFDLDPAKFTVEEIEDLALIAAAQKSVSAEKVLSALVAAKKNKFDKALPNFKPFEAMLIAYLQHEATDGWIYMTDPRDGRIYPELVINISTSQPRDPKDPPSTTIRTVSFGPTSSGRSSGVGMTSNSHSFGPSDVARRRISDILAAKGLFHETPELRAAYDAEMKRFVELIEKGFSQQFVFEGTYTRDDDSYYSRSTKPEGRRKVIHDLHKADYATRPRGHEAFLLPEAGNVPEHPVVRVFDLSLHKLMWAHEAFLTPYVYDKTLKDKLVLPASHRDLLDVMTTDLDAFLGDIIEGKSAGNIILCKGIPGVGKTLTAEIYSEIIEKPLYSVRSGALGTTAAVIEDRLKTLFQQQKRWGCILLLDEADVFVGERGDNIEKNAIVAEFLRVLEYFDGLLFMTTNRPDDIDEAIISRCAAVIGYEVPDEKDRMKVWLVLMANYGVKEVRPSLLSDLVEVFPTITPRDTKMLLRLALRVAKFHNEELTIDIFRRCAMFRAVEVKDVQTTSEMV